MLKIFYCAMIKFDLLSIININKHYGGSYEFIELQNSFKRILGQHGNYRRT